MGADTKIEWTDATVNFWWGCTKVGPGCDHCYAEAFDRRVGGSHWGVGAPRRKIKSAVALIHRLDNAYADWAADREVAIGNSKAFGLPVPVIARRRRVFIQSMSDLFDLEVELDWFAEAWRHIEACNRIDLQIVTKRVSAVEKRLAAIGITTWPQHAGLMITVTDQAEADRDVPRLLALKEKLGIPWVGLSMEPLLGPVDLTRINGDVWNIDALTGLHDNGATGPLRWTREDFPPRRLDWIIAGGESGPKARPSNPQWFRDLRDQCQAAGVAFHFKQWGEWVSVSEVAGEGPHFKFPDHRTVRRVGKKRAGRLLDGREHNEMPRQAVKP